MPSASGRRPTYPFRYIDKPQGKDDIGLCIHCPVNHKLTISIAKVIPRAPEVDEVELVPIEGKPYAIINNTTGKTIKKLIELNIIKEKEYILHIEVERADSYLGGVSTEPTQLIRPKIRVVSSYAFIVSPSGDGQPFLPGDEIRLEGEIRGEDGNLIVEGAQYIWTVELPGGSTLSPDPDPGQTSSFTTDQVGKHTITLHYRDHPEVWTSVEIEVGPTN